ncbi:hypothetical protein V2G26_017824 [Clonostachys chloroleuca]
MQSNDLLAKNHALRLEEGNGNNTSEGGGANKAGSLAGASAALVIVAAGRVVAAVGVVLAIVAAGAAGLRGPAEAGARGLLEDAAVEGDAGHEAGEVIRAGLDEVADVGDVLLVPAGELGPVGAVLGGEGAGDGGDLARLGGGAGQGENVGVLRGGEVEQARTVLESSAGAGGGVTLVEDGSGSGRLGSSGGARDGGGQNGHLVKEHFDGWIGSEVETGGIWKE